MVFFARLASSTLPGGGPGPQRGCLERPAPAAPASPRLGGLAAAALPARGLLLRGHRTRGGPGPEETRSAPSAAAGEP